MLESRLLIIIFLLALLLMITGFGGRSLKWSSLLPALLTLEELAPTTIWSELWSLIFIFSTAPGIVSMPYDTGLLTILAFKGSLKADIPNFYFPLILFWWVNLAADV